MRISNYIFKPFYSGVSPKYKAESLISVLFITWVWSVLWRKSAIEISVTAWWGFFSRFDKISTSFSRIISRIPNTMKKVQEWKLRYTWKSTILDPIVSRITKALILSSQNPWPPRPKTVASFMDDPLTHNVFYNQWSKYCCRDEVPECRKWKSAQSLSFSLRTIWIVDCLSSETPAKKSKMALESFSIRVKSMLDGKTISFLQWKIAMVVQSRVYHWFRINLGKWSQMLNFGPLLNTQLNWFTFYKTVFRRKMFGGDRWLDTRVERSKQIFFLDGILPTLHANRCKQVRIRHLCQTSELKSLSNYFARTVESSVDLSNLLFRNFRKVFCRFLLNHSEVLV